MKSLCVFIHYSKAPFLPGYVKLYVNELANFFDQVVLLYNQRPLSYPDRDLKANISLIPSSNIGYDFGHFYRYISSVNYRYFDRIACINDSNILFNSLMPVFDWAEHQSFDFWGLIDSEEKPWFSTHSNNYHIQSHFIVFHRRAIDLLDHYFKKIDAGSILREKNTKKLRRLVIDQWEIGLSCFLFEQGLIGGSFIDCRAFLKRINCKESVNPGHTCFFELAESGLPVLKKKVIISARPRLLYKKKGDWQTVLLKFGRKEWDMEKLIDELKTNKYG